MSDENPTVHVHRRAACAPLKVADLVGRPYEDPNGCWSLARIVLARLGVELPADPAAALQGEAALARAVTDAARAGDLLVVQDEEGQHVGVCLNAFQFIHAGRAFGTRIESISVWERTGRVQRRARFYALHPEPPATVNG